MDMMKMHVPEFVPILGFIGEKNKKKGSFKKFLTTLLTPLFGNGFVEIPEHTGTH